MQNFDILDDRQNAHDERAIQLRERYLRWLWFCLATCLIFVALPSLIMWNYSPSEVNEFSPIDAHVLVISLFSIAAVALLAMIILLFMRWQLGRGR